MKADEHNFVELTRKRREEGILYVIETYGGLLRSIVGKRLCSAPDRIEECMNREAYELANRIETVSDGERVVRMSV